MSLYLVKINGLIIFRFCIIKINGQVFSFFFEGFSNVEMCSVMFLIHAHHLAHGTACSNSRHRLLCMAVALIEFP